MNPKVDQYLIDGCMRCSLGATPDCKVNTWKKELELLRSIVLECGLEEELKWGMPCYTYKGNNVLIVAAFKDFCSVSFFKGTLLNDPKDILELPGKNSQASKRANFTSVEEVVKMESDLKAFIFEAIELEKAGKKVLFKKQPEPMPEELEKRLAEDPKLKAAFEALTPGRQRGYILHFAQPKQSQTRYSRIEKCIPKILEGKGFHDR